MYTYIYVCVYIHMYIYIYIHMCYIMYKSGLSQNKCFREHSRRKHKKTQLGILDGAEMSGSLGFNLLHEHACVDYIARKAALIMWNGIRRAFQDTCRASYVQGRECDVRLREGIAW